MQRRGFFKALVGGVVAVKVVPEVKAEPTREEIWDALFSHGLHDPRCPTCHTHSIDGGPGNHTHGAELYGSPGWERIDIKKWET